MTELDWDTETDEEWQKEAPPPKQEEDPPLDVPGFEALFSAPDYAAIVNRRRSKQAREYEVKVQSMMKALTLGSLKRGDLPDAAALLQHGPGFAKAAGDLTDESDAAKRAIDMLTAPDSPWFVFGLASVALLSQVYRNHQPQIEKTAEGMKQTWREKRQARKNGTASPSSAGTTTTIKLPFGRKITFRTRFRVPVIGAITRGLAQTAVPPEALVYSVFSDEKLREALRKQGIHIGETE